MTVINQQQRKNKNNLPKQLKDRTIIVGFKLAEEIKRVRAKWGFEVDFCQQKWQLERL